MYLMRLTLMVLFLSLFFSDSKSCKAENVNESIISITNLSVSPDESIVSFEIVVEAGVIYSISNIPVGWYFSIDNDASLQTKIKANTIVGAASLSLDDFKAVQIMIRKNEFGGLKLGLSGKVSVTKDYENERLISLSNSDFVIAPRK
jgi:hypothetical protein